MATLESRVSRLERAVDSLAYEREVVRGEVGSVNAAVDMTHGAVRTVDGKVDRLHDELQAVASRVDEIREEQTAQREVLEQILRRLPILPIEL